MTIRVAVDAMGGDQAPDVVINGALEAVQQASYPLTVLLVGPEAVLNGRLHSITHSPPETLQIVDAPEVIGMDESPAAAVKTKRRSSIHVGLSLHKTGQAQAFASAGNTGAVMAASLFVLGRLPQVARPSIVGYYPTTESFCIVLDVGANVDCKPEHLVQFTRMGAVYAERILNRPNPTTALMNIGEEPGKGNEAVKAAYELLKADESTRFIGNIEGRDLMHHAADVVVCDGFVGNIMLKLGESVTTAFAEMVEAEIQHLDLDPAEQDLLHRVLRGVGKRFNYEEYGGAPLLGVNGNVMIGHGGSTARAIAQMILRAGDIVEHDVCGAIETALLA